MTIEPGARGGWIRRLLPFLAAHKRSVIVAFGVSILGMLVTAFVPLIEKYVIDNVIVAHRQPIGPWIALLVGSAAFAFVMAYVRRYVGGRFALDVQYDLRNAIFERLQRLDFARHDEMSTGQLVSRASSDVALVQGVLQFLPLVTGNIVMLAVALVVMVSLSPPLTVVALVCLPAVGVVAVRLRRVLFPATWDAQQRAAEVAGVVDEAVTGVRVVKGFGQEGRELEHLEGTARHLFRSRVRAVYLQATYTPALQTIPVLGQVAVLALGGWLALHGEITLGTFLAFSSYLVQLTAPVRMFAGLLAIGQQARAGAERILDILDTNALVTEEPGAADLRAEHGLVELDHVSFGYLRDEPVLRDLSLRIEPGTTVALVGTSGSGKSTVSLLLPRFYDVQRGAVRIDGRDVREVTLDSLRRAIGVAFEDSFLFSDTVRANIAYGRPGATEDQIVAAARAAGADAFIAELPDGYDTMVGEFGLTLSGGQRQRVALARAVLTDPRILVLDDATSAVDARTEEQIHDALRTLMAGRTTVVVAHRRSTLRLAERIVVLDRGEVVDDGTQDELMARCSLFRALLSGPGEGLEELPPAPIDDLRRDGVTPALWPDGAAPNPVVAASATATRPALGPGRGGGGGMLGGMGSAGGLPLTATPELLEALDRLPPADEEPHVDVATEAAEPRGGFRLRRLLGPFRAPLLIGLALVIVDTLLTLAGPFLIQRGLQASVVHHSEQGLWAASGLFLLTTLLDWWTTWGYTRINGRTAERLLFALRIRIFAHLQRLGVDFYDREMAGRVMTRMTTDVEAQSQLLQSGLVNALVSLMSFFGVLVALTIMSWRLMLPVLLLIPPLAVATLLFRKYSNRAYGQAREHIATVNADFQENLSGVRVSQAFTQEDRNIDSFRALNARYLGARLDAQRLVALYFPFVQFLAIVGDALVLGFGSHLAATGAVSATTIIAFLLYLDQFFSPIQQLSQVFDQWQQARASLLKIDELLTTPSSTPVAARPTVPDRLSGRVSFDDVHFRYAAGAPEALRGIDLEVRPGETVALVGETGAGKSTLVKLVARFYDATSGVVSVDGTPIPALDLTAYRRRLGYVPQEPFLFTGTIRDNIAYGRPDATPAEVEAASRAVGAHELVTRLPGGYLAPVTERGRSLSAGERQLICLARALLVDPAILLLDEATANLDLATEAAVQRAMGAVAEERTTLLIAHRLPTARGADRIVVVDGGRVVEQGDHESLLARGGAYAGMWSAFTPATASAAGG